VTTLPRTAAVPVVRTDFGDQAAWDELRTVVTTPNEDDFVAAVEFVEDRAYADLTIEQVTALVSDDVGHPILVVADRDALGAAGLPLLVVDLREQRGRAIRVVAAELWGIENNLSLANMDFHEFADHLDGDGIFRGF